MHTQHDLAVSAEEVLHLQHELVNTKDTGGCGCLGAGSDACCSQAMPRMGVPAQVQGVGMFTGHATRGPHGHASSRSSSNRQLPAQRREAWL